MEYETVIGLEVHLQLKTKTKAFCGCSTDFGGKPNAQTCPVCLGLPGSLPVLNKTALDYAIKVALALSCEIQEQTKFDRKNYFYPDLPKAYQISQYDLPLSRNGYLDIVCEGNAKRVGVRRAHLEEDAGKLIHKDELSLADYNRTGVPLLEIVSEPDMQSPQEAYDYLVSLKSIIEYLDVSDCDMEKGSLRCDANISLKKKGDKELGVKAELKNMNSFRAVKDALNFEIQRQVGLLNEGKPVSQETRLWDAKELKTISMRAKEEAQDYRYFPEPDLPMFVISQGKVREIKGSIPELPKDKIIRFARDYGISGHDAKVLVISRPDADYAENCLKLWKEKNTKPVVNFLIGPLLAEARARNCRISRLGMAEKSLVELVNFTAGGQISNLCAKAVLKDMLDTGKTAASIIESKNLIQISDSASLDAKIDEAINENPKSVQDFKGGKENALMFLVGQVMKKTQGKANPKLVQEMLKGRLK